MRSANVVLVAPRLMSLAAPLDPTNGERAGIIDECQALAADVGVHVTVLYCACHRRDDIVHQMLGRRRS